VPELATLHISRHRGFPLGLLVVKMDDRELTKLGYGQYWVGRVKPGRRILSASNGRVRTKPLELVLASGEDARLETRIPWTAGIVRLVRTDGPMTDPPVHPPASPLAVPVLGFTETHRSEEPIGTETRRIDNTSGVGRVTRTIRVTKGWNHTVSLDLHTSDKHSGGGQIGPNWLAVRTSIEQAVERTYDVSVSRREEFTEEVGVEIEPGADVTIIFTWKRIWQHGLAHVLTQGHEKGVPFRMAVGVSFDQAIQ
jgi:hypothetical protein